MAEETKAPETEQTAPETQAGAEEAAEPEEAKDEGPSELEKLQGDYDSLNDRYLRLMAEYDNFRKRSQRERDEIWPNATAAAVTRFLDVADNFERALQSDCADADFKKGMEMIFRSMTDTLDKLGVKPFGEAGEPFDPNRHNAVMHIDDDSLGEQVVAQVLQKGYVLGDKVIRVAMVQVAN